jgi:hypothetical protein
MLEVEMKFPAGAGANLEQKLRDLRGTPTYLQQAGKPCEAWEEFHDLLFLGYTNQPRDVTLIAQDRTKIFDKMRLFLEAEGNSDDAVVFGVFSRVCKGISLHLEGRTRELQARSAARFLRRFEVIGGTGPDRVLGAGE